MTKELISALDTLVDDYTTKVKQDFKKRWNSLQIDMSQNEVYEVLAGLLARQITITSQFANNYNCWTFDLAPLILRSLADNYINFAWISKDKLERSQKFILHGLGQEKLVLEHMKKQRSREGINPEDDPMLEIMEQWLNSQRYTFLTDVNIGSWAGLSIRQMAEDADCIDFYNYVYTPFSLAAHNSWGHIAKYNLEVSSNPLHKYLKVPVIRETIIDLYNIQLAVKYTDKMERKFDEVFGIKLEENSAYDNFLVDFERIIDLAQNEENSSARD